MGAELIAILKYILVCIILMNMSGTIKIKISKEYLEKEYIENNISAERISKILKCSNHTIIHRLKRFNLWSGRRWYRNLFKGRKHSEETKEKMRNSSHHIRGKNHSSWKGGITGVYRQIWNCYKYKNWIKQVFERDNYICQGCGARNGNGKYIRLNAHHIKSTKQIIKENNIININDILNCNELFEINNGITLCVNCHKETDNYGWKLRDK